MFYFPHEFLIADGKTFRLILAWWMFSLFLCGALWIFRFSWWTQKCTRKATHKMRHAFGINFTQKFRKNKNFRFFCFSHCEYFSEFETFQILVKCILCNFIQEEFKNALSIDSLLLRLCWKWIRWIVNFSWVFDRNHVLLVLIWIRKHAKHKWFLFRYAYSGLHSFLIRKFLVF